MAEGATEGYCLRDRIEPVIQKDYEPSLDQKVLAAMMKIAKERVSPEFLPDIYGSLIRSIKIMRNMRRMYLKTSLIVVQQDRRDVEKSEAI